MSNRHILTESSKFPGMWLICYPDGTLSDMLNYTRAHDLVMEINNEIEREGERVGELRRSIQRRSTKRRRPSG